MNERYTGSGAPVWKSRSASAVVRAMTRIGRFSVWSGALLLVSQTHGSLRAQAGDAVSTDATTYVSKALDIMEGNSIHKKTIDWKFLRQSTLSQSSRAKNTYETYDAIRYALSQLGDHHSFLQLSPDLAQKESEAKASLHVVSPPTPGSEPWPPSPYINRREPEGHLERVGSTAVARIVVPEFDGPGDNETGRAYATKLQTLVRDLASKKPAGWIVDVRGNLGGNMWPMLAGIGPLLGQGDAGAFLNADGQRTPWFYEDGKACMRNADGTSQVLSRVTGTPFSLPSQPPVAVLMGRGTASSGEAIAISFRGRGQTRFFGRHTHGESTATNGFPLSDGANLVLTVAVELDRTGKTYEDGLSPDVELPLETALPPEHAIDPMTRAAIEWIASVNSPTNQ